MKKDLYKKIFVILLVSFIIFNIYNVEPSYSSGDLYINNEVAGEQEYVIAKTIKFSSSYYGEGGILGAILDEQGIHPEFYGNIGLASPALNITIENQSVAKSLNGLKNLQNSSEIAVIPEKNLLHDSVGWQQKSKVVYKRIIEVLAYKNNKGINKICDLGSIYIIKGNG